MKRWTMTGLRSEGLPAHSEVVNEQLVRGQVGSVQVGGKPAALCTRTRLYSARPVSHPLRPVSASTPQRVAPAPSNP